MTDNLELPGCYFLESDAIMHRMKQNIEYRIQEEVLVIQWEIYTILVKYYDKKIRNIYDSLRVLQHIFTVKDY